MVGKVFTLVIALFAVGIIDASAQGWTTNSPKRAASSQTKSASTKSDRKRSVTATNTGPAKTGTTARIAKNGSTPQKLTGPPVKFAKNASSGTKSASTSVKKPTPAPIKSSNNTTIAKSTSKIGKKPTPPSVKLTETTATTSSRERRATSAQPAAAAEKKAVTKGRCDPDKDQRLDLSGTYNGQVNYPAGGLTGPATLSINGNKFTLTSGSKTESGNITAVVTCNYTAVTMMFGQWKTPQPGEPVLPPLPMLSLTALRKGEQLSLHASPSERREFLFATSGKN